ncbi:hypothetical protein [Nocardia sp. NPDC005366]|uniref:hypothetical protein n=1 Tax=Nocardia sp. NPDC005366 TaxID=3156878 RepID=UPI0033B19262
MRRTIGKFGRKALIAALPLAVAVTFVGAGTASADTSAIAPQSATAVQIAAATEVPVAVPQVAPVVAQPTASDVEQSVAAADLQDIATDPNAANHDPLANGAVAGAIVGGALGVVVCAVTLVGLPLVPLCALGPALQGALVGLIVGAVAPNVIPQVLP